MNPIITSSSPLIQPPLPCTPGATGSAARLAVLLYLAHRPKGERLQTIAEAVQLDKDVAAHVLGQLRQAGRTGCDGHGYSSVWFSHQARARAAGRSLQQQMAMADTQQGSPA